MTKRVTAILMRDVDFNIQDNEKRFRDLYNALRTIMENGSDTNNINMPEILGQLNGMYHRIAALKHLKGYITTLCTPEVVT